MFIMNKNYSYFIYFLLLSFFLMNFSLSKIISNNIEINQVCSQATYDNTSINEECIIGPKKETRILEYETFDQYISSHKYKHNGLPFYTSLFVDTDFHNLKDFLDGGVIIIILFIIAIIFLIAWIPMIFCWKYKCCLFDECCTDKKCCKIFWNILIYFLFTSILSFILVCIIFAE